MTPHFRALLLMAAACVPALAGDGPTASPTKNDGMANMPMPAAPANPAPKAPAAKVSIARVNAAYNAQALNASQSSGLSETRISFASVRTAAGAQDTLNLMRDIIREKAETDEFRAIGSETVQKIADSIKSDEDFQAIKGELERLPEMLKTQLASDLFKTKHDMARLSPEDRQVYKKITDHYGDLMSNKNGMDMGTHAGEMPQAAATEQTAQSHAGENAKAMPAPTAEGFMDQFHADWRDAAVKWAQGHTNPAPAPNPDNPPPTPATGGTGGTANGGTDAGSGPIGFPPAEHMDDMISAAPSAPANWQMRADYKLKSGDFAGAASDAARALSLGGGIDSRLTLGEARLSLGDKPAAHEQAAAALESDPNNLRAVALLHFSESFASVAAPKAPSFGGSAGAGGIAGKGEGGFSPALLNAGRPQFGAAELRRRTESSLRLNDLPAALAFADRALAQDPNNAAMLNLRAAIHARMHDYELAAADAREGLKLAPHNETLLKTLAYAQVRGRHDHEALASANELLALNPADPYALALRAHAEGDMGERDAMMADINRAAALDARYAPTAAELAKLVQVPSNEDVLFLFPGESAAPATRTAARGAGRGHRFGLLVGASALGGLLLALGLLTTVLAPLKERVTSAFTRITRSGPAANETAQPASVNGLVPGLIRGQYEIARQIGAGGMGMVYEGTDRSLGRRVAIKKMRDELRINPQERARFVIEAKTVAALHHANIVDIYAIAEEGEDVYLIFEYVDGKTVHELVQLNGRLPLAQAAGVVRAAAGALDYAHAHGVIHRDMKPSNVMLDSSGRVKVMDFGIARMAKDSMTRYSMTNTVVGTPPYMAPEQEQGHVRRESDVYALAVCAYEMLTGKLPFIGIGAGMLMNKINMSYVAPSRAIAGVPEALDDVFAKAFQADPDKRYRTPKEFADALEAAPPSNARIA